MIPSLRIVESSLDEVRDELCRMAHTPSPFVTELARYVLIPRGQLIRPALLLASSLLGGASKPPPGAVTLAVTVELIHGASLLHDDVVDSSRVRRRLQTVNAKWGNKEAVLLGDFVLARALACLSRVADSKIIASMERITGHLAMGQLVELHHAADLDLAEPAYLHIIADKTANFFAECAYLGGLAGGLDDEALVHASAFGLSLGMVYQILDDLLDVTGSQRDLGKDTVNDAVNGTITLPIIRCLARVDDGTREALRGALRTRDLEYLRGNLQRLVIESGARDACLATAHDHARAASEALERLPEGCSRPVRRALAQVVDYVFARVDTRGDGALAEALAAGL